MFILSDLDGNLIQFGTDYDSIDNIIANFRENLNKEIIATQDEEIIEKAIALKRFKLKVENGIITDAEPLENPPDEIEEPTVEERLTAVENVILNLL